MNAITRDSLMSLEEYAREREAFRHKVMAHKKNRRLAVGDHVTLMFEDELTIRYQIQEMLRIERTFEEAGINDELEVYNPMVPDGSNWKVTMLIEFSDEEKRRQWLARLIGVEDRVWVQVTGFERVYAIADEDLERETDEKTSSVHFLRFELDGAMIDALKRGTSLNVGIDHSDYRVAVEPVPEALRQSLCGDLHP